ncbi:MAG: hypothetical protein KatS3mg014_1884 [Actinomycetota bacterium]|nr:MAG: hypothetical protein KatS3mg014_1884 [Actinomycetota bacterium]
MRVLSDEEVLRRTRFEGLEHLRAALELGRGVVAVIPHTGNWDVAGRWLSISGYQVVAVAEVLRPRRLTDLFIRHREALGMRILPLERGSGLGRRLAALLAENRIVALVADRDLTGRGIEVEMFGAPRRLPTGARHARRLHRGAHPRVLLLDDGGGMGLPRRAPRGRTHRGPADGRGGDHARHRGAVRASDRGQPRGLARVPARLALRAWGTR